jgi:hypothetical protein
MIRARGSSLDASNTSKVFNVVKARGVPDTGAMRTLVDAVGFRLADG